MQGFNLARCGRIRSQLENTGFHVAVSLCRATTEARNAETPRCHYAQSGVHDDSGSAVAGVGIDHQRPQWAPPSTYRMSPVTVAASVRYITASAISLTVDGRPIGERLSISSL